MSLPKEPRQKMINIMYLVLTALLALNVSSEILNAFKTIDQSLTNANVIIQKKNQDIYKSLESKLNDPKTAEKAAIWAPKANKVKAMADEMYAYVESLKLALKEEAGLKIEDGKETFKEDDLDATTRLFLNKKSGLSKGEELFNKLKQFKQDLAAVDPAIEKAWGEVNVYVGGDHATRHLIYARFWHKFLFDIGVVPSDEPFFRLRNVGLIL